MWLFGLTSKELDYAWESDLTKKVIRVWITDQLIRYHFPIITTKKAKDGQHSKLAAACQLVGWRVS